MKKLFSILVIIVSLSACTKSDTFESVFDKGNTEAIAPIGSANGCTLDVDGRLLKNVLQKKGYDLCDSGFDATTGTQYEEGDIKAIVINKHSDLPSREEALKRWIDLQLHFPEIDFEKFSLVIGARFATHTLAYRIGDQRIIEENDHLKLYVKLEDFNPNHIIGSAWDYFATLYPKLPDKPIQGTVKIIDVTD